MKIVYLSAAGLPSEKSHSLSIVRVCQALTDAGHDVTLSGIAPYTGAPDPIAFYGLSGGFRILRSTMSRLWNNRVGRALHLPGLVLALKTRRLVRDVRPDLIYSRLTLVELVLVPRKTTIVYEMHSLGPLPTHLTESCSSGSYATRHSGASSSRRTLSRHCCVAGCQASESSSPV